jgi:hypothetical protein
MNPPQEAEVIGLRKKTIDGMVRYLQHGEVGYAQKHVDRCAKILDRYLDALKRIRETGQDEQILREAKTAVLDLNALNEKCDGALLETDQREQICELMIVAAKHAGLTLEGDFTEEWREW